MNTTPFTIGTFGLGCVGRGFLELLDASGGTAAHVKHICVKELLDIIQHPQRYTQGTSRDTRLTRHLALKLTAPTV